MFLLCVNLDLWVDMPTVECIYLYLRRSRYLQLVVSTSRSIELGILISASAVHSGKLT